MRSRPFSAVLAVGLVIAVATVVGTVVLNVPTITRALPLAGAIFTTTPDGVIVNENVHYADKREVYLDGGPGPNAPSDAAGLPNGDYVFQVTDPSGAVLLSQDTAKCRVVRVSDGTMVALLDWDGTGVASSDFTVHNPKPASDDACHRDGQANGRHDTNPDSDDGPSDIVVQLMPFFDTPNPGGVYKAWLMPVGRYAANGGNLEAAPTPSCVRSGRPANCQGRNSTQIGFQRDIGFGPPRDQVKTDNFKVRKFVPPMLRVRKFNDLNNDGVWQRNGEPEIGVGQCVDENGQIVGCPGGWKVFITEPLTDGPITNIRFTPVQVVAEPPGVWTVEEATFANKNWHQTVVIVDGVSRGSTNPVTVTVSGNSGEEHEVIFGNGRKGTPTPTHTPTATKTKVTSTPTATRTPGQPGIVKSPGLANLWLCNVRDALTCNNKASGVEQVNLNVDLDQQITSPDPKCTGFPNFQDPATCPTQTIGSFQFEVIFDAKFVSVQVKPGSLFAGRPEVTCASTASQGFVKFYCVTKGKPENAPSGPGTLAVVQVRPMAVVRSLLVPSQLNGIATQLLNQNCHLGDLQGRAIKTAVCGAAAVTIRYLEGDVRTDCVVDSLDQEQVSLRVGTRVGDLLYTSFMDLDRDGDIDAQDLQFVVARQGSTCKKPHPPQDPVDPKAKL